jgi:O-antigen ligase
MVFAIKSLLVLLSLSWLAANLTIRANVFNDQGAKKFRVTVGVVMLTITLAFVSHNFWIYTAAVGLLFGWASKKAEVVPLLTALLFAVPFYQRVVPLPGGGVAFTTGMHEVVVCLAALWVARTEKEEKSVGSRFFLATDLLIFSWLIYQWIFLIQNFSITHTIKTAINDFTYTFLIYYIFSRGIRRHSDLNSVLATYAYVALFLALVAAFESVKHWLLYPPIDSLLSIPSPPLQYLIRSGFLRAQGSAGHPIVLGVLLGIGVLCWAALREVGRKPNIWWVFCLICACLGLIFTFSRGSWMATALAYTCFIFFSRNAGVRILQFSAFMGLAFLALKVTPGGEKLIAMLPFFGQSETGSVDYRARLFEISMYVFWEHPWLGSPAYMQEPVMQSLIQGQGIIDMVNSYLAIALSGGIVGLTLFSACFLVPMLQLFNAQRARPLVLPQMVLACLILYLVVIATVSTINSLTLLSSMLIGLCAGAARLTRDGARQDG